MRRSAFHCPSTGFLEDSPDSVVELPVIDTYPSWTFIMPDILIDVPGRLSALRNSGRIIVD